MAEGIIYLDVDDEITSAAQRIRSAPGTRVALVVPYGSRIATSRMNFRILSREAVVSNKRLSFVSGDSGSRSLAASAGLPVFGSVQEYESSRANAGSDAPPDAGRSADAPGAAELVDLPGEAVAPSGAALAASETVVRPRADGAAGPTATRKSQRPRRPIPDPDETTAIPTIWSAGSAVAGPAAAASSAEASSGRPAVRSVVYDPDRGRDRDRERVGDDEDGEAVAGRSTTRGRRVRAPILAAIGVAGLAAIVLAVGAYLFLPSAAISLVPRREPIGPISIDVSADPAATDVDVVNGVVPAVRLDVPVEIAQTFATTGTHVELSPASGSVTFQNIDPTSQNTIAAGRIVSTEGGIRFRTAASVTIPAATLIFPPGRIEPSSRSVRVTAVKDGTAGNVPANAIRFVPQGENPEFLKVNNPDPTAGGSRTVTPEVTKEEVDQALVAVRADLQDAFGAAIASGAGAPPDSRLFPETALLGEVTVDGDPQALVGEAVDTFDVKVSASGTVLAVDPRPVRSIAEARLTDAVGSGHRLVDGSVDISVGEGSVGEDGGITFEASARATRVTVVDPAPLRDLVRNRSAADATAALAPYGDATVVLWPDWVTTVTTMDTRLQVTVVDGLAGSGEAPSGPPSPTPSPARPSASERDPDASSSGDAPSPSAGP